MNKSITATLIKRQYNISTQTNRWLFKDKLGIYYEWHTTQPRFMRIGDTFTFRASIESSYKQHSAETYIVKNLHHTKCLPSKSLKQKLDYTHALNGF
ncbi:hypothetical protein CN918_30410 [Priestia megaterium]|nr:hypothetical protein CN918_30410 [Priestia megaterium]